VGFSPDGASCLVATTGGLQQIPLSATAAGAARTIDIGALGVIDQAAIAPTPP
jgi:hypothetical protein